MIIVFLIGFFAATIGIALPGLINMTAAKISMQDGKERALSFVFGALFIIVIQTYLAIVFCKFIASNYAVLQVIRKTGVIIFSSLTIYFLFFAKTQKFTDKSSRNDDFIFGFLNEFKISFSSKSVFTRFLFDKEF